LESVDPGAGMEQLSKKSSKNEEIFFLCCPLTHFMLAFLLLKRKRKKMSNVMENVIVPKSKVNGPRSTR
jgi:hypothetical protein